jgi:hypothetical protein
MWDGMCEVLTDRECTHVRIHRRLAEQGRGSKGVIAPKDYSVKRGPGSVDARGKRTEGSGGRPASSGGGMLGASPKKDCC